MVKTLCRIQNKNVFNRCLKVSALSTNNLINYGGRLFQLPLFHTLAAATLKARTRKPCYRKDDWAMHPIIISIKIVHKVQAIHPNFVHAYGQYTLHGFWFWTNLSSGNFVYFCKSDVSAVQGHPRSVILVPKLKAHMWLPRLLVRNSSVGPTLHRFGDLAGFMCSRPHPYSTRHTIS